MQKMNFTTKQAAFDYALYMIASSYFDKTVCKSKLIERNMVVQYKEQKTDIQYKMEDICIKFMDSLEQKLPVGFFRQEMTVRLRREKAGAPTEIIFENGRFTLSFYGICVGKKYKVDCKFWKKITN